MSMWSYWKSTYHSRVGALESVSAYAEVLKSNEELRYAVMTIKQAEARIDQIIENMEDER